MGGIFLPFFVLRTTMNYQERERRLYEILRDYGATGDNFLGIQSAIEELMDDVSADAYNDGVGTEREMNAVFGQ